MITILLAALGTAFYFVTRQDAQELKNVLEDGVTEAKPADQSPVMGTSTPDDNSGSATGQLRDAASIVD